MDFTYATGVAVYRVCVYISMMTSGEFVKFGQDCQEHQKESCVLHILDNISDKQKYLLLDLNIQ